jgi:hypothetical protein
MIAEKGKVTWPKIRKIETTRYSGPRKVLEISRVINLNNKHLKAQAYSNVRNSFM